MDTNILDVIDTKELGRELQEARKKRGLTQEDAAQLIGVARTTLVAIEKGERRIKAGELIDLARAYGRQVSDFVRARPKVESFSEPFQVQFRGPSWRTEEDETKIGPFIDEFEDLCRDYLEIEEITEAPLTHKYPPEYEIARLSTQQAAEGVALEERARLGLGDGPIPMLNEILEQDVGLRIFYIPLPGKFSEIYHFDWQLGGCIAINSSHPKDRALWSLAHGYAHFLAHRYKAEILVNNGYQRKPESEKFADSFALYFLMPTSAMIRRYNDILRTKGGPILADLLVMAHYYGVSFRALMERLETIGLLPTGVWSKLNDKGFKVREAQQQLGLDPTSEPSKKLELPKRYQYLALVALESGLITEAQFAHFLRLNRLEARKAAESLREQSNGIVEANIDQDPLKV
jgi:Zn-dependent peptidase ImmA (M78 family)/DNA-binding XRE family transcriptional regulator